MGWWSKTIETDEGKVYNVWDSGHGRLDVHRACLIDSFGAKVGSTDNLCQQQPEIRLKPPV
jgi:hypothetical protein